MFHALGFMQAMRRRRTRVDARGAPPLRPRATLDSLEEHRATAMVMVPVMLRRFIDLGEEEIKERDLSSLRIIFVSGSALGADLAQRATRRSGRSSTTCTARPRSPTPRSPRPRTSRQAPGTVGKVVRGSVVKLLDENGKEVPRARAGGSSSATSPSSRATPAAATRRWCEGLMASGDVGHFDSEGRLFIDGRDDEMIVSGGENVFPAEVEELLGAHDDIPEAAAIGVEDEKFGQRLKAFVVAARRGQAERGRRQGLRQGEPGQLQGASRGRVPGRAAAQPDRQGPQAGAGRGGRVRGESEAKETGKSSAKQDGAEGVLEVAAS